MKNLTWLLTPIFSIGLATAGSSDYGKEVVEKEVCELEAPGEPCLVYDFVDVSYLFTDFGGHGIDDAHGAGVNLSKGLFGNVYATASGQYQVGEVGHQDADYYGTTAGLGYIIPVCESFHLNVEAGGTWSGTEVGHYSNDEFGGYAGVGFRLCVTYGLEIFGNAYYAHSEGGENTWDYNLGVVYDVCENVGLKVAGLYNPDYEDYTLSAGLRFYY